MICERIIGQARDDETDVDWVEIDWRQTVRRALRLTSRAGRKVDVLLPRNISLKHGDVLAELDGQRLAVWVKPVAVIVIRPASLDQMGALAAELGNQHLPLEILNGQLITLDDGPARQIADELGLSAQSDSRRFHPRRSSVIAPAGFKAI